MKKATSSKKNKKSNIDVKITVKNNDTLPDETFLKYNSMQVARLKEYLRRNKQILTGKKQELIERCVEFEKNGALPICPTCGKGKLRLMEDKKRVQCKGYYDEDCGLFISCNYIDDLACVERLPWKSPEDEIESEEDEIKQNQSSNSSQSDKDVIISFVETFSNEDVKNLKELSSKIVEYCKSESVNIKLPDIDSRARQMIGSMIMQNKTSDKIDYKGMMSSIIKDIGFREKPKASTESKANVIQNNGIALMLDEMAKYTSKVGGNPFKIRGLKKAAIAVRSLNFEIESGIALSKGKTKVAGIGKSTGGLIEEYLNNDGVVQKLLELKSEVGE